MRLVLASELTALLKECKKLFTAHHSPVDNCSYCGGGQSLEEKIDTLEFEHAIRSTLAKKLYWVSVWQNYEG